MSTVGCEPSAATGSTVANTAIPTNVVVKSVISTKTQSRANMENTKKMTALMSKLGRMSRIEYLRLNSIHFLLRINSPTNR